MKVIFNCPTITFRGWEANDLLKGKLNNEHELKALANVAKVNIRSSKCKDNKYLSNHDMYLTTSTKKVGDFYYFATDCYITPKGTPKEELSEKLFVSAEKSVVKLYKKLLKNNLVNFSENQKSSNIFKKLIKFFKK